MSDEISHPLYPKIKIDLDSANQRGGFYRYKAKVNGKTVDLPSALRYGPDLLRQNITDPEHPVYDNVNAALRYLSRPNPTSVSSDRGLFAETISPAAQRAPASLAGMPVDLANLALQGFVDAPINFLDWAFGGFEGNMPSERYVSSKVPIGGSEFLARRMEDVGDLARKGITATEEAGLNVSIPELPYNLDFGLGGTRVGARTLLEPIAFDTSPRERDKFEKYVSLITQLATAAPIEGATIAKLAQYLAKTTQNATTQNVYDAISEMQVNNPKAAAAYESIMGGAVGGGMITSEAALEKYYPDAPQWMKNVIIAGGGLTLPIAGQTTLSTLYDVGLKVPIVRLPLQFARGALESLTLKGADRAAARAVQTSSGEWKDRSKILGVVGQLRLALKEGRDMDEVTRIAFTTPQLARNEARLLEAQLKIAEPSMSETQIKTQQDLIKELRQFAAFQEGQLKTLSATGGIAAKTYAQYSGRMLDRKDSIFQAIDDLIFKTDLGGKPSDGVEPSVIEADYRQNLGTGTFEYNVNRQRAFKDGNLGTLEPEQVAAITKSFENLSAKLEDAATQSIRDAEERAAMIRDGMPEQMSDTDRVNFNRWIRREFETSYREIDFLEDVLWNSIKGLDQPKTGSYTSPDGTDLGPQLLIDGVPISEHFAAKASKVAATAGESENQSKWLWKLAGRNAVVEQAGKGSGPDAEKIAKQNAQIKQQEGIVAINQKKLNRASERYKEEQDLVEITGASPDSPAFKKAQEAFEEAGVVLQKSQDSLDFLKDNLEISMGKGVTYEGSPINVADEITDTGALGVRKVDGILVGRSGQEVQNIISHLKKELTFESSRGNLKKVAAIGEVIDDLQRALGPENFAIDSAMRDAAIKMTRLKKTLFTSGVVGQIRGFDKKGQPIVDPERVAEKIIPTTGQETNLRQIETALASRYENLVGEGTPFRLGEDGTPELNPDFNIQKYSEAYPAPFEPIRIDGAGRVEGFKIADGTDPSPSNIELIKNTLWDRFQVFGMGDEFHSTAAQNWLEKNKSAINWLKKATGKNTGFEDLVDAERILKTIKTATDKNIDKNIDTLRKLGAFNDEFTESGFRTLLKENANRQSNQAAAASFLQNPDPSIMGDFFLRSFLNPGNKNPSQFLNETIKVLENGVLPNGNNPALEGFKQSVAEAIIRQTVTSGGGGTFAAKQAAKLNADRRVDDVVKLWDPEKFIALTENPRMGRLLSELYGKDAPELFRKIAAGARDQFEIGDAATPGVTRQDKVSDEWAGNFGRIIGGASSKVLPISALVLTGMGRRYGMAAIADYRGSVVDKLIIDMLMDPKLAVEAINRNPVREVAAGTGLPARVKLWAHEKFIGDNARRIKRLGQAPGVLYETGEPTKYEEVDEPGDVGPQSAVTPAAPRRRQVAMAVPSRPPVQGSALANVNPVGSQRPSPQTIARGQQIFGVNDPIFANKGGFLIKPNSPLEKLEKFLRGANRLEASEYIYKNLPKLNKQTQSSPILQKYFNQIKSDVGFNDWLSDLVKYQGDYPAEYIDQKRVFQDFSYEGAMRDPEEGLVGGYSDQTQRYNHGGIVSIKRKGRQLVG